MDFKLRYYQTDIIDNILESMQEGYKRFTLFMPLGLGRLMTELCIAAAICRNKPGNRVLYICESMEAKYQARDCFMHYFQDEDIHMEFINCQRLCRNIDSVVWEYFDVIILQNISPKFRQQLNIRLKDSKQIIVSVSMGPFAVKTQYDTNKKVSLFVARDKRKRASMYGLPGVYFIRTKEIIDVRDIRDATPEEIEDIKTTMDNSRDYFLPYEQLVQDGFIEAVSYETEEKK